MARPLPDFGWAQELSLACAAAGQPQKAFQAFDQLCAESFGHRLFTILAWQAGEDELERVHSNRPAQYPVSARKRMGPTAWGDHVLRGGKTWLGSGAADMRWAFPDHELIASLGCGACLNAPVRWNGTVLGAINMLDAEGTYTSADLDGLSALSGFLIGPLFATRLMAR